MPQDRCRCGGQILFVPQEDIVPNINQPRKRFDSYELECLAQSIRANGIIQPINVRLREDGRYELIAGERRLRAARIVGLSRVPCIVMDASDERSAVYALIENLQREDLGFFEEAEAIAGLITEFGLSRENIAHRLGKAQSTISNKLRLLRLPQDVRDNVESSGLTERHARVLLRLPSEAQIRKAISIIIERRLNVAEAERLVDQMLADESCQKKPPLKLFKDIRIFVNTLNHAVDTMRRAGIDAAAAKNETEEYIEYVVRIPKSVSCKVRTISREKGA